MTDDSPILAIEGVRFFGEMSASISHEFKNVLAIINENAGLLEDLLLMSRKGMPIAPERLSTLAQSLVRQVERGDHIVKSMNRFAHSADHPVETVDVGELLHFICNLAARRIAMKGEAPHIEAPETPVTTATNRFFLENLVWSCLCRVLDARAKDEPLILVVEKRADTARIRFRGLADTAFSESGKFPSPAETAVTRLLGAQLSADRKAGEIRLILPERLSL